MRVLATAAVLLLLPSVVPATTLTWEPAHHLAPQDMLCFPVAEDFDGDGDVDISNLALGPVWHYWNVGTPEAPVWELDLGVYEGIWSCNHREGDIGDLDGDGDLDLITTCWDEHIRVQLNVGTPAQPVWSPPVDTVTTFYDPVADLVDFDSDGDLDIIATTSTSAVMLLTNLGSPQAADWAEDWIWLEDIDLLWGFAMCVRFGDLDLDGDMDAVGVTSDTWPQCWENVGTPGEPQFEERPEMLTGVEYEHKGWTFGLELLDIDADGDLDLLIEQYYYGQNLLFLNQHYTPVEPASWGSIKALFR
jgi:hypothetical protein